MKMLELPSSIFVLFVIIMIISMIMLVGSVFDAVVFNGPRDRIADATMIWAISTAIVIGELFPGSAIVVIMLSIVSVIATIYLFVTSFR